MSDNFDPYYKWLGIPPAQQPADFYRLLGLSQFEADVDVIDTAANQRMSYLREISAGQHSKLSQTLLNELSAARRCLLDPDKKAAYDAVLRAKLTTSVPVAMAVPVATPVAPVAAPLIAPPFRSQPVAPTVAPPVVVSPVLTAHSASPVSSSPERTADPVAPLPPNSSRRKWMLIGNIATLVLLLVYFLFRGTGATKPTPRPKTQAKIGSTTKSAAVTTTKPVESLAPAAPAKKSVRFIRIELPRRGTLTLAEVEAFLDGRNIASYGTAMQINVSNGGTADRAIDGKTSGKFSDNGQTHTDETDAPWWQLDLKQAYPIDRIVVHNRTDPGTESRLEGFTLLALDDFRRPVLELKDQPAPKPKAEFIVNVGGLAPTVVAKPKPRPTAKP